MATDADAPGAVLGDGNAANVDLSEAVRKGIDTSVLRRAVNRLAPDDYLSPEVQQDLETAVLRRTVIPPSDIEPAPLDPARPVTFMNAPVDFRVGTYTDLTGVVAHKLSAFYLGALGISFVNVRATIVTEPVGLQDPIQLVLCEHEPPASDREVGQRFTREQDHIDSLDWVPWVNAVFRGINAQLRALLPKPPLARGQMICELPFLSCVAELFKLELGSVAIDETTDFPEIFPPVHFWKSSSRARKFAGGEIAERLHLALRSVRTAKDPYGLWFDRQLVPLPEHFFDEPTLFASASTLHEELLAHLYHTWAVHKSLVSYGVDGRGKPYPILCATTNPWTSRFVCVRPTISVADGDPRVTLTLSFVTREEAMADPRMRIRRVAVP